MARSLRKDDSMVKEGTVNVASNSGFLAVVGESLMAQQGRNY